MPITQERMFAVITAGQDFEHGLDNLIGHIKETYAAVQRGDMPAELALRDLADLWTYIPRLMKDFPTSHSVLYIEAAWYKRFNRINARQKRASARHRAKRGAAPIHAKRVMEELRASEHEADKVDAGSPAFVPTTPEELDANEAATRHYAMYKNMSEEEIMADIQARVAAKSSTPTPTPAQPPTPPSRIDRLTEEEQERVERVKGFTAAADDFDAQVEAQRKAARAEWMKNNGSKG